MLGLLNLNTFEVECEVVVAVDRRGGGRGEGDRAVGGYLVASCFSFCGQIENCARCNWILLLAAVACCCAKLQLLLLLLLQFQLLSICFGICFGLRLRTLNFTDNNKLANVI